jgi:hypothetical protein
LAIDVLVFGDQLLGNEGIVFGAQAAFPLKSVESVKVTSGAGISAQSSSFFTFCLFSPSSLPDLVQRFHFIFTPYLFFYYGLWVLDHDVNAGTLSFATKDLFRVSSSGGVGWECHDASYGGISIDACASRVAIARHSSLRIFNSTPVDTGLSAPLPASSTIPSSSY